MGTTAPLLEQQRNILSAYARGSDLADIAKSLQVPVDTVSGTVMRFAGMDRGRARERIREDEGARPIAAQASRTGTLEALLGAAENHSQARVRTVASKVRALVDTLRSVLDEEDRVASARARVAELEAELAKAKAALPHSAPRSKANSDVRAWAAANGVDCPTRGRVPQGVLAAYRAAVAPKGDQ